MTLLVVGVLLFCIPHLMLGLAPNVRAGIAGNVGEGAGKHEAVSLHAGHYLEWSDPQTLHYNSNSNSEIGCEILCVGHRMA
jgi:hypothetical protein